MLTLVILLSYIPTHTMPQDVLVISDVEDQSEALWVLEHVAERSTRIGCLANRVCYTDLDVNAYYEVDRNRIVLTPLRPDGVDLDYYVQEIEDVARVGESLQPAAHP